MTNWDEIAGRWKQYKGQIREKWGRLTDDDLETIAGKRLQLIGKIQERYGLTVQAVEKQVQEFLSSLKTDREKETKQKAHHN